MSEVLFPIPAKYLPEVTAFVASLYARDSDRPLGDLAAIASDTEQVEVGPVTVRAGTITDGGNIWTQEQYWELMSKGVLSSDRIIALLDALPIGKDAALTLPEIAERTDYSYNGLASALRWLGKFVYKEPLFAAPVWCFEFAKFDKRNYPADYTGPQYGVYWFEPHQAEAWQRASNIFVEGRQQTR